MRPLIFDMLFHDDRQFVMEITRTKSGAVAVTAIDQWSVITRRNVPGYPPTRVDSFNTREEAQRFYESVVTKTPIASLGGKAMDPEPTLDDYRAWLRSKGLTDRDIGVN
jgi:hypothetical protein